MIFWILQITQPQNASSSWEMCHNVKRKINKNPITIPEIQFEPFFLRLLRLLTSWCISPCFSWTLLSLLFRIPFGFLKGLLYHRYITFKNHTYILHVYTCIFIWMNGKRYGKDLVERSLNQKWIFDEFKRRKSHRCHEFMATILSSDSFSLTADWIRSRA